MSNGYKTYSLVGIPHDFMKYNNVKVLVLNSEWYREEKIWELGYMPLLSKYLMKTYILRIMRNGSTTYLVSNPDYRFLTSGKQCWNAWDYSF